MLLNMLLEATVVAAQLGGQGPHLAEEEPGAKQGDYGEGDEHPPQVGGHHHKEDGSRYHLHCGNQEARDAGAEKFGHHSDIFLETVDRIGAVEAFLSAPSAAEHTLENAVTQLVARPGAVVLVPPGGAHAASYLHEHGPEHEGYAQIKVHLPLPGHDVYESLAAPHEHQRRSHLQKADEKIHQHPRR